MAPGVQTLAGLAPSGLSKASSQSVLLLTLSCPIFNLNSTLILRLAPQFQKDPSASPKHGLDGGDDGCDIFEEDRTNDKESSEPGLEVLKSALGRFVDEVKEAGLVTMETEEEMTKGQWALLYAVLQKRLAMWNANLREAEEIKKEQSVWHEKLQQLRRGYIREVGLLRQRLRALQNGSLSHEDAVSLIPSRREEGAQTDVPLELEEPLILYEQVLDLKRKLDESREHFHHLQTGPLSAGHSIEQLWRKLRSLKPAIQKDSRRINALEKALQSVFEVLTHAAARREHALNELSNAAKTEGEEDEAGPEEGEQLQAVKAAEEAILSELEKAVGRKVFKFLREAAAGNAAEADEERLAAAVQSLHKHAKAQQVAPPPPKSTKSQELLEGAISTARSAVLEQDRRRLKAALLGKLLSIPVSQEATILHCDEDEEEASAESDVEPLVNPARTMRSEAQFLLSSKTYTEELLSESRENYRRQVQAFQDARLPGMRTMMRSLTRGTRSEELAKLHGTASSSLTVQPRLLPRSPRKARGEDSPSRQQNVAFSASSPTSSAETRKPEPTFFTQPQEAQEGVLEEECLLPAQEEEMDLCEEFAEVGVQTDESELAPQLRARTATEVLGARDAADAVFEEYVVLAGEEDKDERVGHPRPGHQDASTGTPSRFLVKALLTSEDVRWCCLPLGAAMDFRWGLVPVLNASDDEDIEDVLDRHKLENQARPARSRPNSPARFPPHTLIQTGFDHIGRPTHYISPVAWSRLAGAHDLAISWDPSCPPPALQRQISPPQPPLDVNEELTVVSATLQSRPTSARSGYAEPTALSSGQSRSQRPWPSTGSPELRPSTPESHSAPGTPQRPLSARTPERPTSASSRPSSARRVSRPNSARRPAPPATTVPGVPLLAISPALQAFYAQQALDPDNVPETWEEGGEELLMPNLEESPDKEAAAPAPPAEPPPPLEERQTPPQEERSPAPPAAVPRERPRQVPPLPPSRPLRITADESQDWNRSAQWEYNYWARQRALKAASPSREELSIFSQQEEERSTIREDEEDEATTAYTPTPRAPPVVGQLRRPGTAPASRTRPGASSRPSSAGSAPSPGLPRVFRRSPRPGSAPQQRPAASRPGTASSSSTRS